MIIRSNSIILASDLSPAFLPQNDFAQYKKGFFPLAIVNNLSFDVPNTRSRSKQVGSQFFSQEALQYSPIVNLSFDYVSSLSFENENLLNFFFRANEFFESNFKNTNSYAANLYFLVSDLEYYDFINRVVSKGNLNGADVICFGNCYLNSYSLSLPSVGLPVSKVQMQAVNMEMKRINGNSLVVPAVNLAVGNQESGCPLLLETGSFIQNLQRLNTATGNHPILPTKNSTYFQISTENLQVPSTAFAPFSNCAIDSLELSFGIDRENSYGFGSDFIYDSKIKFPILGSLNVNLVNLNFNTGEGTLTGVMKNESGYNLEMTFSGVNSPAKTLKINNAKLNSHSYSIDYSNYLTSSFSFDFQCNEATGVSSKWSYVESLSGALFSNETQRLLDVNGSGLFAYTEVTPTPPPPTTPPPTTPPPSPPEPIAFVLNYDPSSENQACAYSPTTLYYSLDSSLAVGTVLYTDPELITLAYQGYYTNLGIVYYIASSDGRIASITACPPAPPPTTPPPSPPPTTPPPTPPPPSPVEVGTFEMYLSINELGNAIDITYTESSYANYYNIYRSEDGGSSYILIQGSLNQYNSPFTDATVLGGGIGTPNYYTYYMTAYNESSSYSTPPSTIGIE